MNVIISNKARDMLVNLEIDVIKSLNGEYEAEELASMFSNFFFNKMILDITAIKNYQDIRNLQKLCINLDMDKIILVLDNSDIQSTSSLYLSKLVSMGIYNFATNLDSIMYLYNNPNSYRDVAHIQQLDALTSAVTDKIENYNMKILGIKNITEHAGATTLTYMLKNQLELQGYNVVAIEVGKRDFSNFNSQNLISCSMSDLPSEIAKYTSYDVILIDLNNNTEDGCSDVLYLLEPTYIKLNKLIRRDRMIFNKLQNKKIVLNKSLLDQKDITDFEYESKSKVFYNIPPLDEKQKEHSILSGLLNLLGLNKNTTFVEENRGKILGLFKSND